MRHLRCFLAIAHHGSVTGAAEELNTAQPAISRSLRELEELIGQRLFERTGRGLVPTGTGESLLHHVSTGVSQISRGIDHACGRHNVPVSIGILPNVVRTLAPGGIVKFKQLAPDVDVRIFTLSAGNLVDLLGDGEIDLILGRLMSPDRLKGLSFEHLYSETLIFAVRPEHELAGKSEVSLEAIDRFPVIIPLPDTIIRDELDKFLIARGMAGFSNKIECLSFEFYRACLPISDAIACLPLGTVRRELASGQLARLDIHGDELVSSVGLTYFAGRGLSAAATQLADFMRQEARLFLGESA